MIHELFRNCRKYNLKSKVYDTFVSSLILLFSRDMLSNYYFGSVPSGAKLIRTGMQKRREKFQKMKEVSSCFGTKRTFGDSLLGKKFVLVMEEGRDYSEDGTSEKSRNAS